MPKEADQKGQQAEQLFQATVDVLGQFSPEATGNFKEFLGSISTSPAKTVSIITYEDYSGKTALDIRLWADRSDVGVGDKAHQDLVKKHDNFVISANHIEHWFNQSSTDDAAHDITRDKLLDLAAKESMKKPSTFKVIALESIRR